jgi:hypothetical protein
MALMNKKMAPEIESVYMMASLEAPLRQRPPHPRGRQPRLRRGELVRRTWEGAEKKFAK